MDKMCSKLEDLKELRDLVRSLGRGGGWGPLRRAPIQYLDMKVLTKRYLRGRCLLCFSMCPVWPEVRKPGCCNQHVPSLSTNCVAVCKFAQACALSTAIAELYLQT